MSWLARLLRLTGGQTPSKQVDTTKLTLFEDGDELSGLALAAQHNQAYLAIERNRIVMESLVTEVRKLRGEVDTLQGNPNSVDGSFFHQALNRLEARVIELEGNTPLARIGGNNA